jgi:hypothetical protein
MLSRLVAAAVVACIGVTTASCVSEVSENERPLTPEPVEPDGEEHARAQLREQQQQQFQEMQQSWTCFYSVTYDYDWHNDVLCSNGVESQRPYLRGGDSFVTQDELMQSAHEYEDTLNGGSGSRPRAHKKSDKGRFDDSVYDGSALD